MKKGLLTIGFALAISVFAVAQDGPGGLGTGTGDAGNGDGSNNVNDVGGSGTGTTNGVQGTEAPVDGGIAILFAIGAVYTGVKLSKRKGIYSVN